MMADPESGRILGAAVIGPQGSELIHEVIVAMHYRCDRRSSSCGFRTCIRRWPRSGRIRRRSAPRSWAAGSPATSRWRLATSAVADVTRRRRLRVAIVQTKPRKGRVRARISRDARRRVRATGAATARSHRACPRRPLPDTSSKGAVYDLALSAPRFASDLAPSVARARRRRPVDIAAGFYENDGGTYYNAALYLHVERERRAHRARAPQAVLADVRRLRRGALPLARAASSSAFDTRFGTHGDAGLRGRVARDRAHDRRGQGRAHSARSERVARAGHRDGSTASSRASRAGARCCAPPRCRARRLRPLRRA